MSSGSTHYTNYYASYHINPNNFEGSEKAYVEKHNANIVNVKVPESSTPILTRTDSGSPNTTVTSSGAYITHSYYGNCGHIITSCIG
jgi:hypothetical protein